MSVSSTTPAHTAASSSHRQQLGMAATPPPGPSQTATNQQYQDSWDDSPTTSSQQHPLMDSNNQAPTTSTSQARSGGFRTQSGLNTAGINFTESACFLESLSTTNSLEGSMHISSSSKKGGGLTSFVPVIHQSTLEHGGAQNPLAEDDDDDDPGSPLVPRRFSASMQHRVFSSTAAADNNTTATDIDDGPPMMMGNATHTADTASSRKVSNKVMFVGNDSDDGDKHKNDGDEEDVDALVVCISAGFSRQKSELATAIFRKRGLLPETAQLGVGDHIVDDLSPLPDDGVSHSANGTENHQSYTNNNNNLSISSVHNSPPQTSASSPPPSVLMPPPLITTGGVLRRRSTKNSFHPMLGDNEAVMSRQMSAVFNDTQPLQVPSSTTATTSASPKGAVNRLYSVTSSIPDHHPPTLATTNTINEPTSNTDNNTIQSNTSAAAYGGDEMIDLGTTQAVAVVPPQEASSGGQPQTTTASSSSQNNDKNQDDTDMVNVSALLVYLGTFGGWLFWTVLGLLHIAAVALVAISQLWIGEWADKVQPSVWGIERSSVPSVAFLCIYAAFLILSSILVLVREFLWREGVVRPPTVLYAAMLNAAAHAPQTFFDNNPIGRILTRFSRDAEQLDFDVPNALNEVAVGAFTQVVTLASVCVVIPYFTPVAVVVIVALAFLGPPPATLRLRKIADNALSPVHALFTEVDSGGSAVSALGLSDLFKTRLIRALDNYNGARYMEKISMEFVRLRGSLVMCVATGIIMFVLIYLRDTMTAAASGFIINQALQLTNFVSFMLLQEGTALLSLNSVDRVVQFTEIEQEPKTDPPPQSTVTNANNVEGGDADVLLSVSTCTYRSPVISSPDAEFQSMEFGVKESIDWEKWPSSGEVRLVRCCAQYQPELPLVLRDVSVVFEGGRKVGVCGRTGSGKSTLLQVLLRMVRFHSSPPTPIATADPDPTTNNTPSSALPRPPTPPTPPAVLIDGVDITTVPLPILRQRVTVIPQEPTVFSGSVAYNLSPEFGLWCRNNEALMMSILSECDISDPLAPLASDEENDDIVAMSLGTLLAAACCVDATISATTENSCSTSEAAAYHRRCVIRLVRLMVRSLDEAHLWTFFQRTCSTSSGGGSSEGSTTLPSPFSPLFVELGPEGLLSIGQKQLLCLARAALRRAKLLLLDEATSSVDPLTDKLIQEIVKERFMGCTVITIAHRVDTILDCDDVLVLDRGSVLEFNTPAVLLGPLHHQSTLPSHGAVIDASGRTEAVGAFAALVNRSAPE